MFCKQPYSTNPDFTDPSLQGAWLNPATRYTAKDASNKGNDGTATGVKWLSRGGKFNGDSSIITTSVSAGTIHTVSATIKITNFDAFELILGTSFSATYLMGFNSTSIFYNGGSDFVSATHSISVNNFFRCNIVRNGLNVKFYINGILRGSSNLTNNTSLTLTQIGSSNNNLYLDGSLLDVEIYNEAKSPDWVKQDYLKRVPDPSLLLWLPYGDSDYSRYNRTITNTDTRIGNRMNFNGSTSKLDLGSDFIGTKPTTVSCWVNFESQGGGNNARALDNGKIIILFNASSFSFSSDGTTTISISGLTTNKWYFLSGSRDSSGNAKIYVNGKLRAQGSSGTPAAGSTNIILGNNNGQTRGADGKIRDLRIYEEVKSPEFIRSLYETTRKDY